MRDSIFESVNSNLSLDSNQKNSEEVLYYVSGSLLKKIGPNKSAVL